MCVCVSVSVFVSSGVRGGSSFKKSEEQRTDSAALARQQQCRARTVSCSEGPDQVIAGADRPCGGKLPQRRIQTLQSGVAQCQSNARKRRVDLK